MHNDKLLRNKPAAAYIGWAPSTLAKSRISGNGPPFLKVGKNILYRISDLDEWLESKKCFSTSNYS